MSEQQLKDLLERAVDQAPPMAVSGEQMLSAGRRRRSRRRSIAGGMTLAGLALAGAVWTGLGGGLPQAIDIQPAAPATWQAGEVVDVDVLRTGVLAVDGWSSADWGGRLVRDGHGPSRLELTKDGEPYGDPVVAEPGPGSVEVFRSEEITVATWVVDRAPDWTRAVWTGAWRAGGDAGTVELGDGRLVQGAFTLHDPGVVVDVAEVYLARADQVATASGAEVRSTPLHAGGLSGLAFVDPASRVGGVAVQDLPIADVGLSDPLAAEEALASYASDEDGRGTVVGVLPVGAEEVVCSTTACDVRPLGDRLAVLAVEAEADSGGVSSPEVSYRLDGVRRALGDDGEGGAEAPGSGPPLSGIVVTRTTDGLLEAERGGRALAAAMPLGEGVRTFADTDGTTLVVSETVGDGTGRQLLPVLRHRDGTVSVDPDLVVEQAWVAVDGRRLPAVRVDPAGQTLIAALTVEVGEGRGPGDLRVLGGSGPVDVDAAGPARASFAGNEGSAVWAVQVEGVQGTWAAEGDVLSAVPVEDGSWVLVGRLPEGLGPQDLAVDRLLVSGDDVDGSSPMVVGTGSGASFYLDRVTMGGGGGPADHVAGLDVDLDGTVDVPYVQVWRP